MPDKEERSPEEPSSAITPFYLRPCASDVVLRDGLRIVAVLRLFASVLRSCRSTRIERRTRCRDGVARLVGGRLAGLIGLPRRARSARRRRCRRCGVRRCRCRTHHCWTCHAAAGTGGHRRRCDTNRQHANGDAVLYAFHRPVPL